MRYSRVATGFCVLRISRKTPTAPSIARSSNLRGIDHNARGGSALALSGPHDHNIGLGIGTGSGFLPTQKRSAGVSLSQFANPRDGGLSLAKHL